MSQNGREIPWVNGALYVQNRNKFPYDELIPHAGKYVAFNLEGSTILASGVDEDEVEAKLIAAGHDPSYAVVERIPPLDEDTWL